MIITHTEMFYGLEHGVLNATQWWTNQCLTNLLLTVLFNCLVDKWV